MRAYLFPTRQAAAVTLFTVPLLVKCDAIMQPIRLPVLLVRIVACALVCLECGNAERAVFWNVRRLDSSTTACQERCNCTNRPDLAATSEAACQDLRSGTSRKPHGVKQLGAAIPREGELKKCKQAWQRDV